MDLALFLRETGGHVLSGKDRIWYEMGPRVFFPLPFHIPFSMHSEELRRLWRGGALALRYLTERETSGCPSYMFLLTDQDYSLLNLKSKNRNQTRRGLENCSVRKISFDYLGHEGQALIADTFQRQGRPYSRKWQRYWRNFFSRAHGCVPLEAWGSFVEDQLAAYLISITLGDCAHIHMVFSRSDLLRYYSVNALTFVFAQNAVRREGVSSVSYGLRSIRNDQESLNKFKEGMGFTRTPVRERIEINPYLKPFLDSWIVRSLGAISENFCGTSGFMANAHGLIATYWAQEASCMDDERTVSLEGVESRTR
jgi:hypothetical protein